MAANSHLVSHIKRIKKENPGAFLVSGPWGVGKTFVVKKSLDEASVAFVYVSANGIVSAADFKERILAAIYPKLFSEKAAELGGLAKTALSFMNLNTEFDPKKWARIDNSLVLVVDDIERIEIPQAQLLGILNQYVEHEGMNLVIIGNEEQIKDATFSEIKEKIVRRTIKVLPETEEMIRSAAAKTSDDYSKFLTDNISRTILLFEDAGTSNLRSLKDQIFNFEELYDIFKSRLDEEFLWLVFSHFVVIGMLVSAGELDRNDILYKDNQNVEIERILRDDDSPGTPRVLQVANRLKQIQFFHPFVRARLIENFLFDGVVDPMAVDEMLGDFDSISGREKSASWKRLWYRNDLPAKDLGAAIEDFKNDFDGREFSQYEVKLHAFAIMLEMSERGLTGFDLPTAINECSKYIRETAFRDVDYRSPGLDSYISHTGALGLGFSYKGPAMFDLINLLRITTDHVRDKKILSRLRDQIAKPNPDSTEITQLIAGSEDRQFLARRAGLYKISAQDFAESLVRIDMEGQRRLLGAMRERFENDHSGDLSRDKKWYEELRRKFLGKLDKDDPAQRFWRKNFDRWYFKPVLSK